MHRLTPARLTAIAAVSTALALAGCSGPSDSEQPERTGEASTSVAADTPTSTTTSTQSSTAAASSATTTSRERRDGADLTEVAQRFSTLAPASLWERIETCSETDIAGSFDCSGPEIGQFQLFDSDAKAASTTQLLTELRSSRIVEDDGSIVVGWSTLGTSAIITVVDNDKGQVLQQLVSSDQEEPRERIYKLGLAQRPAETSTVETATETATATETTTPANS
ncbi:hypothetical protein [Corynebacterium sp.]|uniref:hypothetical protein n=1 Tax=Corynebacterium sp. TaxID=1720 RepID=UPI002A915227|nr:hypothetical protein [Corynebacterium sp.]MDY5786357.1 hypothetical protein [Corynebacterium sp.]